MIRHFLKKKWGQNFLVDTNLLQRIVRTIAPKADDRILEIGPGEGALTEIILPHVAQMAAIEIDPRLIDYLKTNHNLKECHFIHGDVLLLDLDSLPFESPVRIIGNIPYNITSPILFWLIKQRLHWQDTFLMVQKELADRLTGAVGTKTYGRLTVMVGAFLDVKICFTIPPDVFVPRPKVDSAIIRLTGKSTPLIGDNQFDKFENLVRAAFSRRRKMLRNSLKGFNILEIIQEEIDFTRRPETLTIEEFVKLLNSSGPEIS